MNDNPIEFLFGFVFAVHSANLERLMKTFGEVKQKWSEKNRSYSSTESRVFFLSFSNLRVNGPKVP